MNKSNLVKSASKLNCIIFSGGGFKGWAYIGTIRALNELIAFREIEHVIGVSVGAIFGLFYLLQKDYQVLINYFLNLDIKKFMDIDLDSILVNQSIIHGVKYKEIIMNIMDNCKDFTFLQLYNLTGKKFTTCAFNITTVKLEYFDKDLTPDIKVIDAIMASSALPLLFPAYKINGNYYYDGGICNNCPCNLVDHKTSIAFNIASEPTESKYKLLNLLMSLTRLLNNLIIKDNLIMFNISDKKYDNEIFNIDQSNDTIFNIYMDGYKNTVNVLLKFFEKT